MKQLIFGIFLAVILAVAPVEKAVAFEAPSLSGSYVGNDSVSLQWSEVGGANYQVWYGPLDNPWAHAVALGQGTQYTVQALFRNTSYVFMVKAIRDGQVVMTNPVKVYVGSYGRPPVEVAQAYPYQQQTVVVQNQYVPVVSQAWGRYVGAGMVYLGWNTVPGARYVVWYGPKNNPYAHNVTLGEGTTYTVQQLFKNTSYVFRVSAVVNGNVVSTSNAVYVYVGSDGRMPL